MRQKVRRKHRSALRWSGLTDRGRIRPNNEDAFLAVTFNAHDVQRLGKTGDASLEGADFVFAVSDGMGGARSGEFASQIALDKITALLPRSFGFSAQGMAAGYIDILTELFHLIHSELNRLGTSYDECTGMGATLSLGWFTPGWMYFGHIGDSRIYYLTRDGGMAQVSDDHTHVGWLRRQGGLNEREARTHPRRNVLSQALGAGHQFIDPHFGAIGCERGDRFVFCTDGVVDGLWDQAIDELVRHPGTDQARVPPAERLVRAAVAESGRDNTTAVVVEMI